METQLGLVVEGGGFRGIYAAGVLDVLHDLHLPFLPERFMQPLLFRGKKNAVSAFILVFAVMNVFSVLRIG